MVWHKTLERQLQRIGIDADSLPDNFKQFLSVVSEAYGSADEHRVLMERAFDLSTKEVKEKTAELEDAYKGLDRLVNERTKQLARKMREAEESKTALEQEKASLLAIGDGTFILDAKGKITFVNKAFENLVGWTLKDAKGKNLIDVLPMQDEAGQAVPCDERPIATALHFCTSTSTSNAPKTFYYVRKDGSRFPVAIVASPVTVKDKVIGAVEIFRDITREREVDKAKTEFVSLASHQLRTPLAAVSWYTEMILEGDVGVVQDGQKKYLKEIYDGNRRMTELVNTLLDTSRLELGTLKIDLQPTDLIALARSVLDEQKPIIENKKLVIVEHLNADVPTFPSDPKLLRMVCQNLLANAVTYTPPEGRVELTISSDPESVSIVVSDTGYGIPESQQSKIFERFFRADNVRAKDTDGTGLGLYITKSVVESFGGQIGFESQEGKGSTFYVTLPIAKTLPLPALK
jgi:PAS domain S-box-containing protein